MRRLPPLVMTPLSFTGAALPPMGALHTSMRPATCVSAANTTRALSGVMRNPKSATSWLPDSAGWSLTAGAEPSAGAE
jgi:hypothetical protein